MTKESTESLISVPKTATMLGISIPYTQQLLRLGKIEGQKIGRDWFTTEEAIKAYLTSRRRPRLGKTWGDL